MEAEQPAEQAAVRGASTDERAGEDQLEAEVEQLGAANAELEARAAQPPARQQNRYLRRARGLGAGILVFLAALLILVSADVVWTRATVLDTDTFVATVGPVIKSDAVTAALGANLTDQLVTRVNLEARIHTILPGRTKALAAPITGAVSGFIQTKITEVLRSPKFEQLWYQILRYTHGQVIAAIEGKTSVLKVTDDKVVLNMLPLLNAGLQAVQSTASGILGRNVTIPSITSAQISPAAQERLSSALVVPVPSDFGEIVLLKADQIKLASQGVSFLKLLSWLLPLITLLVIAAALWLSPRRRRTILQLGVVTFLLFVVERRLMFRLQAEAIATAKPANQAAAGDIVHQITSGFFEITVWVLIAAAVVIVVTVLSGPYPWARAMRRGVAHGLRIVGSALANVWRAITGRARDRGAVDWIVAHRGWMQAGGVALCAILLFFVSWIGVLVVLGILAVYELVLWRISATTGGDGSGSGPDLTRPPDQLSTP